MDEQNCKNNNLSETNKSHKKDVGELSTLNVTVFSNEN